MSFSLHPVPVTIYKRLFVHCYTLYFELLSRSDGLFTGKYMQVALKMQIRGGRVRSVCFLFSDAGGGVVRSHPIPQPFQTFKH